LAGADIVAALRRRLWPLIAVSIAVLLIAVTAAFVWPSSYRAMGTILIEQQELPADLVPSTITSFADQRIQTIGQRVMTTDNLLRVINRYNLYPKLRGKQPREVLIAQLRKDIHLQMISADVIDPRAGHPVKANIAFSVAFESDSPETAARVANEVISLYLDENVKTRRQQTADAERFLNDEANKLDKGIAQMEASITDFKARHTYTLPEESGSNREALIRRTDELHEIDAQLSVLDEQASFLDTQMAEQAPNSALYTSTGERVMSPADRLKYLRTEYARLSGLYSPDHPDIQRIKQQIDGLEGQAGDVDIRNDLERQLQDYQTQLAQLREQRSADHPDIVKLKDQIDAVSKAIAQAPPSTPHASTIMPSAPGEHPDNPAFIQLRVQRETNKIQHEALIQRREVVEQKITEYEQRVAAAPGIDREFADMLRALENEQIKYREVRQKQLSAKLSENLEDEQKGERFTLIDPPRPPEQPFSPNRKLLLMGGVALALVAGLLVVLLLEGLDGTVRNRRDLVNLLEVPPLAILPLLETRADLARRKRQRWMAAAATTGAFAVALVLTHLLYRPLDLIWEAAVRRLSG
jgi:succinoglycan biosynthesis transport protein ExoP